MFFLQQTDLQKKEYEKFLKFVGAFSGLFSDSNVPALYYRVAEKYFAKHLKLRIYHEAIFLLTLKSNHSA